MKIVEYTIQDKVGLHARPASKLVQSLSKYKSSVKLEFNGKVVNAKSIINLLTLGASSQSIVIFKIEGEDEEELSRELTNILNEHGI
ncbi:HPr family phosphocarrier protein [Candidatus Mycoplasma haematominutum]|uniref:Phosphocarrier protein HPr n=1 Tax=Candidatus Mycoplasma haematominutum 'Birmingham 1' TaxID=1116213 RepID=G8C349_9MOLU|nr:HPr family phosphocarrier protein [Candidatus Mycoplasma haematominutum]CCE66747.1 phosphocarrier protein HPr [Candidatus Mycoplasma haematominutum 'Birmingham 1']